MNREIKAANKVEILHDYYIGDRKALSEGDVIECFCINESDNENCVMIFIPDFGHTKVPLKFVEPWFKDKEDKELKLAIFDSGFWDMTERDIELFEAGFNEGKRKRVVY